MRRGTLRLVTRRGSATPTRETAGSEISQTGARKNRAQASTFAALVLVFAIGYVVFWCVISLFIFSVTEEVSEQHDPVDPFFCV